MTVSPHELPETQSSTTIVDPINDEYHQYETNVTPLNNRYQFIKHLQNGSFGKVSLALDLITNEKVSIKSVSKLNNNDSTMGPCVETAMNEIKILTMINEKIPTINVCKLLTSFEIDNYIIIVLEYCSQGDLYDLIHHRSLQLIEIVKLANQIGNAILQCHSIGIYHRDIKPENILIDSNSNFKLCDWGLATTTRINNEFNVGTEKYMAPECFMKNTVNNHYYIKNYDCKYSDYWSIGITLLTSMFGTCPFKSTSTHASIQFDYNFKNFVNYNNPYILYDIYSLMNSNCFEIFMNLLKIGNDEDDLSTFESKYRMRDLSKFLQDLNVKYIYGFTVDDVDADIETLNGQEIDDQDDDRGDAASLFEMDHDDLQFMTNSAKSTITSVDVDTDDQRNDEDSDEYLLLDYNKNNIPITNNGSSSHINTIKSTSDDTHSKLPPSLIESSVKSTKSCCTGTFTKCFIIDS
ncbi:serine/threonine protein kinase [Scheffersomyces coipomensis]|uniref:serine/threonine protein kinase n=1 Tax=Scheffersomyces coipomensis TaxID=1788519 RepID=UPI00315DCD03